MIKTGLRQISVSYSKISLRDVCTRLNLDSEEDAEYIVAKAVMDGVIDATVNHSQAFVQSRDHADVYGTAEPQQVFHTRTQYCLQVHAESTRAMRYHQVVKVVPTKSDD